MEPTAYTPLIALQRPTPAGRFALPVDSVYTPSEVRSHVRNSPYPYHISTTKATSAALVGVGAGGYPHACSPSLATVSGARGCAGRDYSPVRAVQEAIENAPARKQEGIKTMLIRIDFANGDVMDYFKHLAAALAI
jgi:hypothetical protein